MELVMDSNEEVHGRIGDKRKIRENVVVKNMR